MSRFQFSATFVATAQTPQHHHQQPQHLHQLPNFRQYPHPHPPQHLHQLPGYRPPIQPPQHFHQLPHHQGHAPPMMPPASIGGRHHLHYAATVQAPPPLPVAAVAVHVQGRPSFAAGVVVQSGVDPVHAGPAVERPGYLDPTTLPLQGAGPRLSSAWRDTASRIAGLQRSLASLGPHQDDLVRAIGQSAAEYHRGLLDPNASPLVLDQRREALQGLLRQGVSELNTANATELFREGPVSVSRRIGPNGEASYSVAAQNGSPVTVTTQGRRFTLPPGGGTFGLAPGEVPTFGYTTSHHQDVAVERRGPLGIRRHVEIHHTVRNDSHAFSVTPAVPHAQVPVIGLPPAAALRLAEAPDQLRVPESRFRPNGGEVLVSMPLASTSTGSVIPAAFDTQPTGGIAPGAHREPARLSDTVTAGSTVLVTASFRSPERLDPAVSVAAVELTRGIREADERGAPDASFVSTVRSVHRQLTGPDWNSTPVPSGLPSTQAVVLQAYVSAVRTARQRDPNAPLPDLESVLATGSGGSATLV